MDAHLCPDGHQPPTLSSRTRHALRALALSVSLASSFAHAQDAAPAVPPTYYRLVEDALREVNAKRFLQARALLERAHQMWPNARTLRGLGRVSFELQHYRDAIDYLDRAQASSVQPLDPSLRREAQQLESDARGALARVAVQLQPVNAKLLVDGRVEPLGASRELVLDPGEHAIAVSATGYQPEHLALSLRAAEQASWHIELQPSAANAEPPLSLAPSPAEAASTLALQPAAGKAHIDYSEHPRWLLPAGLSAAFVGAVTAAMGGAFYIAYRDSGDKLREPSHLWSQSYQDRWLDARKRALLFSGIGTGVLTLSAAALADFVPRRERRWLTPTLLVAGGAALLGGLAIFAGNDCGSAPKETFSACTSKVERRDGGSLLAMLSAPLLTLPVTYAVAWLTSR